MLMPRLTHDRLSAWLSLHRWRAIPLPVGFTAPPPADSQAGPLLAGRRTGHLPGRNAGPQVPSWNKERPDAELQLIGLLRQARTERVCGVVGATPTPRKGTDHGYRTKRPPT